MVFFLVHWFLPAVLSILKYTKVFCKLYARAWEISSPAAPNNFDLSCGQTASVIMRPQKSTKIMHKGLGQEAKSNTLSNWNSRGNIKNMEYSYYVWIWPGHWGNSPAPAAKSAAKSLIMCSQDLLLLYTTDSAGENGSGKPSRMGFWCICSYIQVITIINILLCPWLKISLL